MPLAKVLPRGQITIPVEVREAVNLGPGSTVEVTVTGPDSFQVTVLPHWSLDEWHARFGLREPAPVSAEDAIRLGEEDAADEFVASIERNRQEAAREPS